MRIALINGSPKVKDSSSGVLLQDLKACISDCDEMMEIALHTPTVSEETLRKLQDANVWVFAYPLYVDCIPAHLLSCLVQLEEAHLQDREIYIYGIVNCGFYEGIQCEPALWVLQNWCVKSGFHWGGGVGVGGGGALVMMSGSKPGNGPKAPIDCAIKEIADKIAQRGVQENRYVSMAFPRFLYRLAGQMGWRQMIKANGGRWKDLGKRP